MVKQVAPVIGFARVPIKFVALAAFALPLLAAFGISLWGRPQTPIHPRRQFATVGLVLLATMAALAWRG